MLSHLDRVVVCVFTLLHVYCALMRVSSIMGPTGAGKSTVRAPFFERAFLYTDYSQFINHATSQSDSVIGHGLSSQTSEIRMVRCTHPIDKGPVVLVDTPGFDDTYRPDIEILTEIGTWLTKV